MLRVDFRKCRNAENEEYACDFAQSPEKGLRECVRCVERLRDVVWVLELDIRVQAARSQSNGPVQSSSQPLFTNPEDDLRGAYSSPTEKTIERPILRRLLICRFQMIF